MTAAAHSGSAWYDHFMPTLARTRQASISATVALALLVGCRSNEPRLPSPDGAQVSSRNAWSMSDEDLVSMAKATGLHCPPSVRDVSLTEGQKREARIRNGDPLGVEVYISLDHAFNAAAMELILLGDSDVRNPEVRDMRASLADVPALLDGFDRDCVVAAIQRVEPVVVRVVALPLARAQVMCPAMTDIAWLLQRDPPRGGCLPGHFSTDPVPGVYVLERGDPFADGPLRPRLTVAQDLPRVGLAPCPCPPR